MFIFKLNKIIEAYDPYGNHRVNGLKATYILLILFFINLTFTIPNPYFYFFYIPLTAMIAEISGDTPQRKNKLLFYCMLWSIITTFIFDFLGVYPLFFVFALFYSIFLYLIAIKSRMHTMVVAPIALSLGAYSLLYNEININSYTIINNAITTIVAMTIIFTALLFFPRSYYYRLWLRAFLLLITQIINHLTLIIKQKRIIFDPVQGHTNRLVRYTNMLPNYFPLHTIWRINLLTNQLHLKVCVTEANILLLHPEQIKELIEKLSIFKQAILTEQICYADISNWKILKRLVHSWNYLCLTK